MIITGANFLVDCLARYTAEKKEAEIDDVFSKAQIHLLPCIHTGYNQIDVTRIHVYNRVLHL